MASYELSHITGKGLLLLNHALIGNTTLNFTRMAVGRGQVPSSDYSNLTGLVDEITEIEIDITSKRLNNDGTSSVIGHFTNKELTETYFINEVGLFALDVDGNEILYSYTTANGDGDYIGNKDSVIILENLEFITFVSNISSMYFEVFESRYAKDVFVETDEVDAKNVEEAIIELSQEIKAKPSKYLTTITHNLGKYPIVQVLSTRGAYGIGDFGALPFGGFYAITEVTRQRHTDNNSFDLLVNDDLKLTNPLVTKLSEQEWVITFDDTDISLIVLLNTAGTVYVDNTGEVVSVDTYTKDEIDGKNGVSSFVVYCNGGQVNNNASDPNTSFTPSVKDKWCNIPMKASTLVDANNAKAISYYANFVPGADEAPFVNDIAEKTELVTFEPMCFMQNKIKYNSAVRVIAHKADVPEADTLVDALNFSDDVILLAQQDFNETSPQRNGIIASRGLRSSVRDQTTGQVTNINGWVVKWQMLTDNLNDYMSDKSYFIVTFHHKK